MAGFNNMDMQHLYVVKSIDFGKTWRLEATLDKPIPEDKPFTAFCEPYILQLRDGSYIASARGQTGGDNDLLRTYLAYSDDGKNWSDFEEVEGLIGAPAHLFETKAGVLIMAYSYRLPPTGSRAMISYDGGKTWSDEITLCLADNSGIGDLGYPSTVELSDGTLITAYYQRVENARGEFGVYINSTGGKNPYRVKFRSPCMTLISALDPLCKDEKIADLIMIGASLDYVIPCADR
jgi:hypothetical protein